MSASGYMIFSGTQAPWSRPRLRCSCTGSVSGISPADLRGPARWRPGCRSASGSTSGRSRRSRRRARCGRRLLMAQRCRLPVRGDDQDRLRLGQRPRPVVQLRHPVGHLEQHRGAVAEVEARQRAVLRRPQPGGCALLGGGSRRRWAANGCRPAMRASATAVLLCDARRLVMRTPESASRWVRVRRRRRSRRSRRSSRRRRG